MDYQIINAFPLCLHVQDLKKININTVFIYPNSEMVTIKNLTKLKPLSQNRSNKIITTFYPRKLLQVKEQVFVNNHYESLLLFYFFISLLLFLFTIYKLFKKEDLSKQAFQESKQIFGKTIGEISEIFIINEFIFHEKIEDNRRKNTVSYCCKHYFLDLKKNETVVVTRDFPEYSIHAGMKGVVNKVLLNQKMEITFFSNSNLPNILIKSE